MMTRYFCLFDVFISCFIYIEFLSFYSFTSECVFSRIPYENKCTFRSRPLNWPFLAFFERSCGTWFEKDISRSNVYKSQTPGLPRTTLMRNDGNIVFSSVFVQSFTHIDTKFLSNKCFWQPHVLNRTVGI